MSTETHNIQDEVKGYIFVFIGLLFLTIVTVSVSYLHLNIVRAIILSLIIATIKAALVACYFMHLISEKKMIYIVLMIAVIFFASLIFLLISGYYDTLKGTAFVS